MNLVFTFPIAVLSQYLFGPFIFILSLFMVLLILVQRGKGGGLTGALGGPGGQSAFGTKAGDLFTRITIVTASCWIFVLALAVWWYTESDFGSALSGAGSANSEPGTSMSVPANFALPEDVNPSTLDDAKANAKSTDDSTAKPESTPTIESTLPSESTSPSESKSIDSTSEKPTEAKTTDPATEPAKEAAEKQPEVDPPPTAEATQIPVPEK